VAAAAGLAVIEEFERLDLVVRVHDLAPILEQKLKGMTERHAAIGDVRGIGFLWGIELVADRESRTPFAVAPGPRVVRQALREERLLVRASRDVVQIAPALVATEDELEEIVTRLDRAIGAVLRTASRG
jgi:adenosylmethionine-8-amino-7-oxononanoate aminotransferase